MDVKAGEERKESIFMGVASFLLFFAHSTDKGFLGVCGQESRMDSFGVTIIQYDEKDDTAKGNSTKRQFELILS